MEAMTRWLPCLCALVAASACSKGTPSPTSPTPPSATNAVSYTAIAASDGIGFGGSAPCVPFSDCPAGTGYVQILARRLVEGGRTVAHLNLSIPGAVMSRAVEDLAASIGRSVPGNFVERESPFVPAATTHVTVFAGGNDANTIALAAADKGAANPEAYADTQLRQWGTDIEDLIKRIRDRAPNARVVALNLPNLAGAPYLASRTLAEKRLMQRVAVGLTDRINALTARNVIVVDLMCDARLLQASNYATDGFHPSDSGYAVIAELVLPALQSGAAPPPSSTCALRSRF